MFRNAIVRTPCENMVNGITNAKLGAPVHKKALAQHEKYIEALISCGVSVTVLEADNDFPDSTFIEDTALLTPHCAIIANPGAAARKGETKKVEEVLKDFYKNFEYVKEPDTVEPGDIMMVGEHFYIGLSKRTNKSGAEKTISILKKYGMTGSVVTLEKVLHLKTGMSYLEHNNLVVAGEFIEKPDLQKFNLLKVDADESYAGNCIWVNDKVLVPAGFPKIRKKIENAGYETIALDMSEFRKLDGGLSCLSLRF
ncbi:MAG TPA: arginine deiminase family protein [Bacteroidales bacterium]|nr:arginine deiminase family protein [Bacteroidales bacterium]HPS17281.1 arginine deiminase family protein [Bacteroidales bacterium]